MSSLSGSLLKMASESNSCLFTFLIFLLASPRLTHFLWPCHHSDSLLEITSNSWLFSWQKSFPAPPSPPQQHQPTHLLWPCHSCRTVFTEWSSPPAGRSADRSHFYSPHPLPPQHHHRLTFSDHLIVVGLFLLNDLPHQLVVQLAEVIFTPPPRPTTTTTDSPSLTISSLSDCFYWMIFRTSWSFSWQKSFLLPPPPPAPQPPPLTHLLWPSHRCRTVCTEWSSPPAGRSADRSHFYSTPPPPTTTTTTDSPSLTISSLSDCFYWMIFPTSWSLSWQKSFLLPPPPPPPPHNNHHRLTFSDHLIVVRLFLLNDLPHQLVVPLAEVIFTPPPPPPPHNNHHWLTFSDHLIVVGLFLLNDLPHQLVVQLTEVIFTPPTLSPHNNTTDSPSLTISSLSDCFYWMIFSTSWSFTWQKSYLLPPPCPPTTTPPTHLLWPSHRCQTVFTEWSSPAAGRSADRSHFYTPPPPPHNNHHRLTFSDHLIVVRLFLLNDLLQQLVVQLTEVIFTPPPPPPTTTTTDSPSLTISSLSDCFYWMIFPTSWSFSWQKSFLLPPPSPPTPPPPTHLLWPSHRCQTVFTEWSSPPAGRSAGRNHFYPPPTPPTTTTTTDSPSLTISSLSDCFYWMIFSTSWSFNWQKSFLPPPTLSPHTTTTDSPSLTISSLSDCFYWMIFSTSWSFNWQKSFLPPPPSPPTTTPPTHLLWPSHRCQTVCTEWSSPPAGCSCTCPQPWHSPHPGGPPASRGRGRSPAGRRWCTPTCTQSQTPCAQEQIQPCD